MDSEINVTAMSNDTRHKICPLDHDNSWGVHLTRSQASGRQALCIPAYVLKSSVLRRRPEFIKVTMDGKICQTWKLHWAKDRLQCVMGRGWYEFCRKHRLKEQDVLHFALYRGFYLVHVQIDRAS